VLRELRISYILPYPVYIYDKRTRVMCQPSRFVSELDETLIERWDLTEDSDDEDFEDDFDIFDDSENDDIH
jgi:hypothetical protein